MKQRYGGSRTTLLVDGWILPLGGGVKCTFGANRTRE